MSSAPSPIARLNPYLWRYRRLLIPGLLFSVASAVFAVMIPAVVRQAVDTIPRMVTLGRLYDGTPVADDLYVTFIWAFAFYGLVVLGLSLLGGACLFIVRQTVVVASRHIEYDLRNRLYGHVQKLPQRFFRTYSTGDVITRSTSDIEQIRRYVGPALMYLTRAVVFVVAALVAMLVISPRLTMYALIPMPLLAVAIFFMSGMIHRRSEAVQQQYSQLTSKVQEVFSGIRVVKAYTREAYEAGAFEEESRRYRTRSLSLAKVDAGFRPVFVFLIGSAIIIVVWIGGRLAAEGLVTVGNIAEFIIYVTLMTWPVASLGFVINMVQRASVSSRRLYQILDTVPAIADSEQTDTSIRELSGELTFKDVHYRYEADGPDVLRGITFSLPAGKTLGIVGRTGSGKSTLIDMIPRLIDPTDGTVEIDGHDAPTIPLEVLRSHISYVPQDVFLFSDSIAENIAFGNADSESDDIAKAAREADLLENVQAFPEGFETLVGERGVTLSGGQKQRTSIARATIRDPRILILDDALSAVDTGTEDTILGYLRQHYGRRTVVIVSHRISAVQDADLILVLDDGQILERGTHTELLENDRLYADLYRKQLLQEEIEALG